MLYSVTASHYDCNIKGLLLNYTIESLVKNNIDKCLVSISFNSQEHYVQVKDEINYLKKTFGSKLKIHVHYTKLYQFQHLQYLCSVMNSFVNSYDKIIFCDDDDILIELPPVYEYDVISGFQYITGFFEDDEDNFNNYEKIIELTKSENVVFWKKVDDFSGYVCNYELFKSFFELNKYDFTNGKIACDILSLQLIDIDFMKYLDNCNAYKPNLPFVYHRLWTVKDRPIQQWRENCVVELNVLLEKVTEKLNTEKEISKINNNYFKIKKILTVGIICASVVLLLKHKFKNV